MPTIKLVRPKLALLSLCTVSLSFAACQLSGDIFSLDSDHAALLTTSADAVLSGRDGALVGGSIAMVGDLDGDGIDDMVLADPLYARASDQHNRGAVHVVYGRESWPLSKTLGDGAILEASAAYDGFVGVAPAGDIDGDGYADFLVSNTNGIDCLFGNEEPPLYPAEAKHALAHIIYGGPSRLTGTQPMADVGPAFRDPTPCTGAGVSGIGDLDGDGLDDILIGTDRISDPTELGTGRLHLIYGSRARKSGVVSLAEADAVLRSPGSYNFGTRIASAGDVDNDGLDDVLVGQVPHSYFDIPGAVFLIPGSRARFSGDVDVSTGSVKITGDVLGLTFSGAGDLDQDGYDDFVIDAFDLTGPRVAHVFYGRQGGFPAMVSTDEADATIVGEAMLGASRSAASAGDVNNDGHPDLLFGDIGLYDGRGGAYLLDGQATRWSGDVPLADRAMLYVGNEEFIDCGGSEEGRPFEATCAILDAAGVSLASGGDVNGDGVTDFAIGAPTNQVGGPTGGSAYIVFGRDIEE